ncbi:amidohydrolase family protein [Pseudomonas shirazica]|nr:amidohydrolase family protein [Pseudomonas shirazica]
MSIGGFDYHLRQKPPSSETLAMDWAPYILTVIELFGVERCMFESNFPVDKGMFSYSVLWNSFKRLVSDFNSDERTLLFSNNAIDTYKLSF